MAFGGSLPQINLGVQGVTQGGHHSGAQRVNPEFRVGSNFRIIPEQYFSRVENVQEFLRIWIITYYEIPTQLACAYLKGHLTGRALDWFEVLGVVDNQRFDGRRWGGQSDHRFHNQGGRQGGSRNSTFRGQNDRNRYLNF
ncbi:uncharacterized protein TNCV_4399581 [Trichonephila clavipes]|nr:uncharacterized protein TNCV_4399581 [Trichonephila clavipes]